MPNAARQETGWQKSREKVVTRPSVLFARLPNSMTMLSGDSGATMWMFFLDGSTTRW